MTKILIRFQPPFDKADRRYIDQLLREELPAADRRIAPEGQRQVPASPGEIRSLVDNPRYQAKRLARFGGGNDHPTPPGGMALRVAA